MLSPFANAQGKLREASRRPPREALRFAQGDTKGPSRGIKRSTNPGFRRGDLDGRPGGWGYGPFSDDPASSRDPRRATIKVAPTDIDAYWGHTPK